MLRVRRSLPSTLFYEKIEPERDRLLDWANIRPEERRQRRAPIEHDMFRSGDIVDMVASDFDDRCGYCERAIGASEGIGHFRPLSMSHEDADGDFVDYYSWLAFEWLNLFLLCRRCQKAKSDRFPVKDRRRARYLATLDEVRAEENPLLIDPTVDNPSTHIAYLMSGECISRRNSPRSFATIDILDLNNIYLIEERREAINESLRMWRRALEIRAPLHGDFLLAGSYLGACRDVIVRTLGEYRPTNLSVNNGPSLRQHLDAMIHRGDTEELDRMVGVIELMKNSDNIRRSEFERQRYMRPEFEMERSTVRYYAETSSPRVLLYDELLSPRGDLRSFQVSHFRAIDNVEIQFPKVRSAKAGAPCILLLGENAVGKSTCLSALALALLGTRQAKKLNLPYHELARSVDRDTWNLLGKQPLEVTVRFHDQREFASFRYNPVRNEIDGTEEQSTVVLGYGPHRYFANAQGRRGSSSAERVRSLFDPRKPLPNPSDWLRRLEGWQFDEVARTIRTILPTGDNDQLVKDRRAGICVLAQGQLTPVSQLSEGYRSVFAMVTDMCRSLLDHWSNLETAQGVVLIDEIETHLHPRWKMRVMSALRQAFPGVQFIATTHDPLCLRGMDNGEVIVLTRDENGRVHILEDLPDISGMRVEQILTSEYFGLSSTIDPEVHLEIARLAHAVEVELVRDIGAESKELISKLTVGDSAAAQIIHEALLKYLRERDLPTKLSLGARADAVATVFKALRASRPSQ